MGPGSTTGGRTTDVTRHASDPVSDSSHVLDVVLAGGRRLLRDALASLLADDRSTRVVASTAEVLATEAAVARANADVVVAHVHLGEAGGGVTLAARLRAERPKVGVVLLLGDGDLGEVHEVLDGGTARRALLMMDNPRCAHDLPEAIQAVAAGGSMVHPDVVEVVLRSRTSAGRTDRLTPTETAVLRELAAGRSNAAIAEVLGLSARAVEKRIGLLYDKLDLPSGAEVHRRVLAARVALEEAGRRG